MHKYLILPILLVPLLMATDRSVTRVIPTNEEGITCGTSPVAISTGIQSGHPKGYDSIECWVPAGQPSGVWLGPANGSLSLTVNNGRPLSAGAPYSANVSQRSDWSCVATEPVKIYCHFGRRR